MRLTKPMLMSSIPVLGEPWDMLGKMMTAHSRGHLQPSVSFFI